MIARQTHKGVQVKRDLDRLMSERELDAAVVTGGVSNNPAMYYMTNGAHLSGGILIKKRGEEPVLLCHAMERDEAAKSGLRTISLAEYDLRQLLQEHKDHLKATVKQYEQIFADLGVSGRVAFYGVNEQGESYALLRALDEALPDLTVVGEFDKDLFTIARETKEPDEIERLRRVGEMTATIMGEVIDFMRDHAVQDETLVKSDGSPLTVGDVKKFARSRLFLYGLEDPEGMIFAIGADAGVPHSQGEADDPIRLGQSIVYDFYPREMGGGYFHDMTRTFCLGYAPPEVQKAYEQVFECFNAVMDALKPNTPTRDYEELTCDVFECQGHNTPRQDSQKQEGYVHSLGHGVGLRIHEAPGFGLSPANNYVLQPGAVFTVEPGVYYPERGFGVRIEDTVYLDENGEFHSLTDFPKDLVIEM